MTQICVILLGISIILGSITNMQQSDKIKQLQERVEVLESSK